MTWKSIASLRLAMPVLILVFAGWGAAAADDARPGVRMVDPAIDAEGPWCFLAKPNGQLGVPGARRGAQVTFDGAINTPGIELVFLTGEPLRPIMVRQKTLFDGYIPIIQYSWSEGTVIYQVEAIASKIYMERVLNDQIIIVTLTITNNGELSSPVHFGIAARHTGMDHRFEGLKMEGFSPGWLYEIKDDMLIRNNQVVLVYPKGLTYEAVPGVSYAGRFNGQTYHLTERAEFGLARPNLNLGPSQSVELVFLLPMEPINVGDEAKLSDLKMINISKIKAIHGIGWKLRSFRNIMASIPENKVQMAFQASLNYAIQAIHDESNGSLQGVNKFQYNGFWLRDAAYIIRMYDVLGKFDSEKHVLCSYPHYQKEDGRFESQRGQLDGFGQALYTMGQHAVITGDKGYAELIWPHFPPAVEWLKRARAADPMGLMPATEARDNELIIGHYTGHNFWALLGLRTAIRIARMTDHQEEAAEWLKYYDEYEAHFLKELEKVAGRDGYIPPGLDAEGGQDWGNLIGVYPAEVLAPDDPCLTTTLARMHAEKIEEGLMTYLGRLHHYLTVKEAQNHVARGEQEEALRHLYAILLHMDSSHAMFEWQAEPWGSRDVDGNFPPHGWGGAMYNLLLRNMLVREAGGRGGLEPRDLHLFSVVSPEWAKPESSEFTEPKHFELTIPPEKPKGILSVQNAPTEAGPISAKMIFTNEGATVEIDYPSISTLAKSDLLSSSELDSLSKATWTPARAIVLHIPYFAALESFTSDVPPLERRADELVFPPNVKKVELQWTRRDVEPLSFEKAVADYKAEYARRFAEYVEAGGVPLKVEAPPLLTADERRTMFNDLYGTPTVGLAVGKPVTTNAPHEEDHRPEFAVDGNSRDRNTSSWWAAPPAPRWLQIDLEEPTEIAAMHVYPYWDGSRYYQYVVDVSLDGKEWERVADRSEAVEPESAMGHRHEFAPRRARFVRVTMLYNSANPSLHLVEVRVFPPDTSR